KKEGDGMLLRCWLALLVALIPAASSTNAGVKVRLTEKGIEYGKRLGMAALQTKLKSIKVPDISGSKRVMRITNIGLPKSEVDLVPGSGVKLSIGDAYIICSMKNKSFLL
uniref:Bactericidal permeability-increasing protein n=1 Tax=Acanthochromis polyacanthus TaxID=80966 RepID=A0A3Q1FHW5_9TELE